MTIKRNSGITIVALVVTIVVLSILAGTALTTVIQKNDGLIDKSKETSNGVNQLMDNNKKAENILSNKLEKNAVIP